MPALDPLHHTRTQSQREERVQEEGYALTHSAVAVAVDIEYTYGALVAHALLGDAYDLLIVVGKGDALHRGRELPHEEGLARLHGPESHLVVRGSRNEEARLCCVRDDGQLEKIRTGRQGGEDGEGRTDHAQSTSIVQTVPLWPLYVPRRSPL